MATREETIFESRKQRSMPRPIGAPDIRQQTRLVQNAGIQDKINSEKALTDTNHKTFSRKVGIGTRATYSTLPANAGRLNESQSFTAITSDGGLERLKIFTYRVPAGRVLYITSYEFYLTGAVPTANPGNTDIVPLGNVGITIAVDGSSDPWNQRIACPTLGGESPTHIIAGFGQVVNVFADLSAIPGAFDSFTGKMLIRGDMLISNDNAVPYTALEVSNGKQNHE